WALAGAGAVRRTRRAVVRLELQFKKRASGGGRLRRPRAGRGVVAKEDGARAVEHAGSLAEDALDRGDEVGGVVREHLHLSRSGTKSKPIAVSSACATRKSAFSANCGPISCRPTGSPSDRPHGMFSPGSPAMFDGIVSTSERYMASGSAAFSPIAKATVGLVGETSTSKRSKSASCSRLITVRTFCAVP